MNRSETNNVAPKQQHPDISLLQRFLQYIGIMHNKCPKQEAKPTNNRYNGDVN